MIALPPDFQFGAINELYTLYFLRQALATGKGVGFLA